MNQKYDIIELDWDTKFFGIKSAKVNLNNKIDEKDIKDIKNEIRKEKYRFVTINNKNNCDENNFLIKELENVFLADVNIQFIKKIKDRNLKSNDFIKIQNNFKFENQIIDISRKSFIYSRFYNDKNLKDGNKVYTEWAKNAFDKEDKYFCVYKKENNIIGYVLFSVESNFLTIELIAINDKEQSKRSWNSVN